MQVMWRELGNDERDEYIERAEKVTAAFVFFPLFCSILLFRFESQAFYYLLASFGGAMLLLYGW